jgi:hypothetical protein
LGFACHRSVSPLAADCRLSLDWPIQREPNMYLYLLAPLPEGRAISGGMGADLEIRS